MSSDPTPNQTQTASGPKLTGCRQNKKRLKGILFLDLYQGLARTQTPTTKNYAPELPTFGVIAGVNQTEVQW